jgi:hypothetical protein
MKELVSQHHCSILMFWLFAEDEYPASGRGDHPEGGAEPHHGALHRDYKAAGRRSGNLTTPLNSLVSLADIVTDEKRPRLVNYCRGSCI